MKALLHVFLAGAALLSAFTPSVSARNFLFLESSYLGDGWFRYTISAPDDPFFLFVDVGSILIGERGMTVLELAPPPPRWTNDPSIDETATWVSEDLNGWNVNRRPYSTRFSFRSADSAKRGVATLTFSLAIVGGWDDLGPIVSGNVVGYWNAQVLLPGPPDGSGTNLLASLSNGLPEPVMATLVRNRGDIAGVVFDYPNLNTMRLEGSRDLNAWTNIAYIFGDAGRTTWTSSTPLNEFGNFFRVSLVAEGHATVLPPLNPASARLLPAGAGMPAGPAPTGVDSGVRLLSMSPCIEGADLTLAVKPGRSYIVTLLDDAMQPAWSVATKSSGSTALVRMPTASRDFGIITIKEDPK